MSSRCLIDTSVVSLIFKGDRHAAAYRRHLEGRIGLLSFVSYAELLRWPEERDWGARRRDQLIRLLEPYDVVFPDTALCRRWAVMVAELRRRGRTVPFADSWIAATALHLHVPVITHNPRDFRHVPDLDIVSEVPLRGPSMN